MARPTEYRPCVGMMVINNAGQVLIGNRITLPLEWQMPQGGIDDGENEDVAALRELREEIGTDNVTILSRSEQLFYYDLPDNLIQTLWKGKYCGQKQRWYLMRFMGEEREINVKTDHPEFSSTRWVNIEELVDIVVPFKKEVYRQVVDLFQPVILRATAS